MSVETTVNTIVIRLMSNSGTFQETETSAETVGELRTSLGLDGTVVVNNQVAAEDSISLRGKETDGDGNITYAGDRVSHVSGNKRGGKVVQ